MEDAGCSDAHGDGDGDMVIPCVVGLKAHIANSTESLEVNSPAEVMFNDSFSVTAHLILSALTSKRQTLITILPFHIS